jgi:hypothetical protein
LARNYGLHFLRIVHHTNMSLWYKVLKMTVYIFILRNDSVHFYSEAMESTPVNGETDAA